MPTITVNVDDELKERMEKHPEINWSEVTPCVPERGTANSVKLS